MFSSKKYIHLFKPVTAVHVTPDQVTWPVIWLGPPGLVMGPWIWPIFGYVIGLCDMWHNMTWFFPFLVVLSCEITWLPYLYIVGHAGEWVPQSEYHPTPILSTDLCRPGDWEPKSAPDHPWSSLGGNWPLQSPPQEPSKEGRVWGAVPPRGQGSRSWPLGVPIWSCTHLIDNTPSLHQ